MTLIPVAVHAQVEPVTVGDGTTIPTTGGTETTTPATPDTGIAPQDNKLTTNALIFIGGSALGAAAGYGAIVLRRKLQS